MGMYNYLTWEGFLILDLDHKMEMKWQMEQMLYFILFYFILFYFIGLEYHEFQERLKSRLHDFKPKKRVWKNTKGMLSSYEI